MRLKGFVAAASLGLAAWVPGAAASTITETINFTASNFTAQYSHPVPTNSITGSITVMLDPTLTYHNASAVIVNSLNVPFAGAALFEYDPASKFLVIGANGEANGMFYNDNADFSFALFLVDPAFQIPLFSYAASHVFDIFSTYDLKLTFTPSLAATPLPGSVLMLLTALAALGGVGVLRHRKMQTGAALVAA